MSLSLTEVTRRMARDALALHRLALAADEVRDLKSPATASRPDDGISRPTEDAALCHRRAHVRETYDALTPTLADSAARISYALDVWEGRA